MPTESGRRLRLYRWRFFADSAPELSSEVGGRVFFVARSRRHRAPTRCLSYRQVRPSAFSLGIIGSVTSGDHLLWRDQRYFARLDG